MPAARAFSASAPRQGEHEFLEGIRALSRGGRGVIVGIGDDAAVVRGSARTVLTTDAMVEGVHFRQGWLTARELGVRAFRAAVSDIAAMGARPQYVLLSLEVPRLVRGERGFDSETAANIVRALAGEARRAGATLVGGNISSAERWGLGVTVVGAARNKAVTRAGAKPGDVVYVTGALGGAAAGVACLERRARRAAKTQQGKGRASEVDDPAQTAAYRRPPLRIELAAALAEARLVHAMIDVSDGLVQDLGHLCRSSGVAIRLDRTSIPVHRLALRLTGTRKEAMDLAMHGGEDYELVVAVPKRNAAAAQKIAARHRCRLAAIGMVERGTPRVWDGEQSITAGGGFDHFA